MQFKVKGQDYFLAFVEDDRRWYLFAPSTQEVRRIPVYVDAANLSLMMPTQGSYKVQS